MMTLAQKVAALSVIAVLDLAMLAFGGVLLAFGALIASLPFTVTVASQ